MGSSSVTSSNRPFPLPRTFKEKIWGRNDLSPWYPNSDRKIGEVWFEADLPLLVKFVLTSERLSVQVHPDDAFAAKHENSRGKTEMWHVLKADPGAHVALGFREPISRERMRESALSGEIEQLLQWVDVRAGDTFFVPAKTVHALGPGLVVCEIQQHSDVTYRLYDYGRPRELHLEKAMQVASTAPFDASPRALPVTCEYFRTESMTVDRLTRYEPNATRFHILVFESGLGSIAGQPFRPGEAWLIPAGAEPFLIEPTEPAHLLRTWVPQ